MSYVLCTYKSRASCQRATTPPGLCDSHRAPYRHPPCSVHRVGVGAPVGRRAPPAGWFAASEWEWEWPRSSITHDWMLDVDCGLGITWLSGSELPRLGYSVAGRGDWQAPPGGRFIGSHRQPKIYNLLECAAERRRKAVRLLELCSSAPATATASGQPAGKMGGAMWLWALGQQTERIKSLRPSILINPRLYSVLLLQALTKYCSGCALIHCVVLHYGHYRAP
jgi:hypothetical protein